MVDEEVKVGYKCCEECLSQMGLAFEDSAVDELESLVKRLGGGKSLALEIAKRIDPGGLRLALCFGRSRSYGSNQWMRFSELVPSWKGM